MFRWVGWLLWRARVTVFGRIPRLLNIINKQGLAGLWEAAYFRLRHPLSRARLSGRSYYLVDNVNGFPMLVDAADQGIARELALFRKHEPLATQLLRGMLREGDTVLDIGANIGYYTLLMAKWVGNQGAVLAVEPHPENFRLLCHNLWLNRVDNVWVARAAVGDKEGVAELAVSQASNWHTLVESESGGGRSVCVPLITVDQLRQLWGRPIRLLRMDTEGYEGHILRGAKRTLAEDRPAIVVEVHPAFLGREGGPALLQQLLLAGYESRFVVVRSEDVPWRLGRQLVRTFSISQLLLLADLFRARGAFTLFLEPVERVEPQRVLTVAGSTSAAPRAGEDKQAA